MIELSDDPARIDLDRVHGWLASSYWTPDIDRAAVERQNAGSHCLGAYHQKHGQIGFARVISDRASFAWLADVWVGEAMRGQGIGRRMVRWFLEHPDYATVRRFARRGAAGPDAEARARGFTRLRGEAVAPDGTYVASLLQGPEGYTFTVQAALLCLDRVLRGEAPAGYQTPATAYGPDLVLEVPGVTREDVS